MKLIKLITAWWPFYRADTATAVVVQRFDLVGTTTTYKTIYGTTEAYKALIGTDNRYVTIKG